MTIGLLKQFEFHGWFFCLVSQGNVSCLARHHLAFTAQHLEMLAVHVADIGLECTSIKSQLQVKLKTLLFLFGVLLRIS